MVTVGGGMDPQQLPSDSPSVILQDVQTTLNVGPADGHKPETIRIITKDQIRDLVVPAENPPGSLIIRQEDLRRIKESAQVVTPEERKARLAALKAEKEAALEAFEEHKREAKQKALLQQKSELLSELEKEAQERARYVRRRADRMLMEQEDEIKAFSQMIHGAKCNMIRDTQILEKQLIAKELEEEEKRLDTMMELERKKANEMQEGLENRRKQELIRGRQELVKQIERNAEERTLRAEKQHQEVQKMLKNLEKMKMEDLKALERKQEQQKKIQAEIKRINDENVRLKEEQRQRERMADEQVLEYQRQKMEREAALEAEQERIRQEKEKEIARLRARQEKDRDLQAELDTLRAKRNQEAAEREWRRKEKEAARKRAELEEMLNRSRLEQIAQRERQMAVLVQQDRDDFERILRVQREQIEKEKAEEARRAALQLSHASAIRRQMQERQQQLVQEQAAAFQESQRLQEEAQQRSQRIAKFQRQKLEELRACGIPDKYCVLLERTARSQASAAQGQAQPQEEQSSASPVT